MYFRNLAMRLIRSKNRQEFAPTPGVARITVLGTRSFADQGVPLFASTVGDQSCSEFRGVPKITENWIACDGVLGLVEAENCRTDFSDQGPEINRPGSGRRGVPLRIGFTRVTDPPCSTLASVGRYDSGQSKMGNA